MRAILALVALASLLNSADSPGAKLLEQSRAALDAGNYSLAIARAEPAAAEFRSTSDARNLAAALRVLGLAGLYSGSYSSATHHLTEALTIARQLHDFGNEIARLNDLGMASYLQGRYREALDRYEEADARVRAVPNDPWSPWARQVTTANIAILYQTLGQFDRALTLYSGLLSGSDALQPSEQAQLLSNVGALRRRLGDPVRALETYRLAQSLYRRGKHADGEIAVLNNIGIVQSVDLGDVAGAELAFSAAKDLAERAGDRPLTVQAQLNRGEARYRAGQFALSDADFSAAVNRAHELGLKEEEWKALYGRARSGTMAADQAHALLIRAVELIESLRASVGSTQLRSRFLADKRAVYDRLIETSSLASEAFRWMEQSRARSLAETSSPAPQVSLAEFQRSLPSDTAVLELWMGSKTARLLWISNSGAGLKQWTPDLRAIDAARQALADSQRSDWRWKLETISRPLLQDMPVLADSRIRRLRIIPDGPMALLPFEAFPLGSVDLLVRKFSISYAPSAVFSGHMKPVPSGLRWPWQPSLAAFGDPQPGSGTGDGRSWAPLPHSRTETMQVAAIMGGKTEIHLGADAVKAKLGGALKYPLIHLATHGETNPQDPERSFLLLAPALPNTQRYDYLFSREIGALPLAQTDLITLSACETNLGEFVPGEGLRGFPEEFLKAGARSMLSSLWSVGDVSTKELMVRFYGNLASGKSADDALRLAKLDFLDHPRSSHPAHWAAFVLNGDSDWTLPRLVGWPWLGLAALALAAAALYLQWIVSKRSATRASG